MGTIPKNVISIGFRVDTPALLREIVDCGLPKNMGVMKIPINQFQRLLAKVAERAIELDDAELNILMLALNLYDVPANDICEVIERQIKRANQ